MVSIIFGRLTYKEKNVVTIMTNGGVGYEVTVAPLLVLSYAIGQEVTLQTHLKVSDSAQELFGFATTKEKEFFKILMTVSGVGPKTAMNILSLGSADAIQSAIARGDLAYLTGVAGLGKKTAERLVVELKGKVGMQNAELRMQNDGGVLGEVVDGLTALGYSAEEARGAVEGLPDKGTTEELLRLALRKMK